MGTVIPNPKFIFCWDVKVKFEKREKGDGAAGRKLPTNVREGQKRGNEKKMTEIGEGKNGKGNGGGDKWAGNAGKCEL